MNREKVYAYIGAIMGAGVVLGIGFAPASWVATLVEEADGGIPFLLVFFLVMFGVPAMAWIIADRTSVAILLLVSLFSLIAFANSSGWVSSLFLVMPFVGLAGATGYRHGGSIGKKADKRAYAELERSQQEREHFEQKKAEIITMIDEALKEERR